MSSYVPPEISTLRDIPKTSEDPAVIVVPCAHDEASVFAISHSELKNRIADHANQLGSQLSVSDVVAIVMTNRLEFIIAFLSTTSAGLVAAPLNPNYTSEEFSFYLEDSGASAVIVTDDVSSDAPIRTAAARRNVTVLTFPSSLASNECVKATSFSSDTPPGDATALFLHTSGTTSRPKGVPLSHKNLVTSVRNISTTYELTPSDRCVLVMPLFHVHGLMAATLATLATGGAVIIPPGGKFSASAFWPTAIVGHATWYTAVPTMHQILLARADKEYDKATAPTLRFIRSCSASLAPSVLVRMEQQFGAPVLEAYAMTEAAHQMTSNPLPKYGVRKPGSVGRAQGVEVVILNDKNQQQSINTIGEVCIRGNNVTKGYHNNENANLEAFAGGWFHTGDQGSLDEEGYLTLTGRIKELVNRGGEKISPLEVDAALLTHPEIKEAVSFAVPDEKYGEEVHAAIILQDGSHLDNVQLTGFAKERLASFKIPKRFYICKDLPRTATGKIQRRIVAKHFLEQNLND